MEFIDKSSAGFSSRFNSIVNPLIMGGITIYKDVNIPDISKMNNVLQNEQKSHCAYCMRELVGGTNDHVIPRSIGVDCFQGAMRKGRFRADMVHSKTWDKGIHMPAGRISYYPHDLAYGNMVLACEECNAIKDNKVIKPIFFDNPTGVSYETNGEMTMAADALCPELRASLNEKYNIRWRCLWYKTKEAGVSDVQVCNAANKTERITLLRQILGRDFLSADQLRLINDANWRIFISFRWFYNYY